MELIVMMVSSLLYLAPYIPGINYYCMRKEKAIEPIGYSILASGSGKAILFTRGRGFQHTLQGR